MKKYIYLAIVLAAILIAFFIFTSLSNKKLTENAIDNEISCDKDGCPLHDLEKPISRENLSVENKLNQLNLIGSLK